MSVNSPNNMELKEVSEIDFENYYHIRSEKKNLFWLGYKHPPEKENFKKWFLERIKDSDRKLFLLYQETICLGSLNIDYYKDHCFIGYSVMEKYEGAGLASLIVKQAIELIKNTNSIKSIKAWINENNKDSEKVVMKNGFKKSTIYESRCRFNLNENYYLYILPID